MDLDTRVIDLDTRVIDLDTRVSYLESHASVPDSILLAKIFSNNKNIIKLRHKQDPAWASKSEKDLDAELRKVMDENDVNHQRMATEKITPRGKATPFLKLTFLTQHARKEATTKLNAIRAITGYIISLVEPREVQKWLPHQKIKGEEPHYELPPRERLQGK